MFHNLLRRFSDKVLPDNFEEVGLIIDEYKNFNGAEGADSLKVNRKNKPILVKGENFEKKFESSKAAIKYFESLGTRLDRKTLNLRLKDGKIYKDYNFTYLN